MALCGLEMLTARENSQNFWGAMRATAKPASWTSVELACHGCTWLRKMIFTLPAYCFWMSGKTTLSSAKEIFLLYGQT